MAELNRSQKAVTSRFAHLADAAKALDAEIIIYVDADEIHETLPKQQRTRIDLTPFGTFNLDAAYALAQGQPVERAERQRALESARQNLRSVLEDQDAIPMANFESADLDLIVDFISALQRIGARSKRDLARFFELVCAGDAGALVAQTNGGARQKLEVRFAHDLSEETRSSLRLPAPIKDRV